MNGRDALLIFSRFQFASSVEPSVASIDGLYAYADVDHLSFVVGRAERIEVIEMNEQIKLETIYNRSIAVARNNCQSFGR